MPPATLSIGIDLGGTKIEAAVLRSSANDIDILDRHRVLTPSNAGNEGNAGDAGYKAILEAVVALLEETAQLAGLDLATAPIGIGMPGAIERRTGHVKNSNTTCLNGRPFRADLCRRIGRQLVFDNDANCFALGETLLGAASEHRERGVVFGVILGTGVGGGVVLDGRTWSGIHGIAGEWGHHGLYTAAPDARACYCGKRGCVEAHLSGPALERRYAELTGTTCALREIATRTRGDAHAALVIEELLEAFGRAIANVIDILDPSAIVLGGGVSNLDIFYTEGRARVAHYVFNDELLTPIVKNALGDSAGVLGAALLPVGVMEAGR